MAEIVNKMAQIMANLNAINIHGKEDIIKMATAMGTLEEVMKCLIDNSKGDIEDDTEKGK